MKKMLQKKLNKKGFTLAELLIVVAIIAVLVAIAIPVFGGAVTKAHHAADLSAVRAAYAESVIGYMTGTKYNGADGTVTIEMSTLTDAVKYESSVTHVDDTIKVTLKGHEGTFPVDNNVTITTK